MRTQHLGKSSIFLFYKLISCLSYRPLHHSTTYETKSKLKRVVILGLADSPKSIIVNGEGRLKQERQRIDIIIIVGRFIAITFCCFMAHGQIKEAHF